jgi:hypothetical protein
VKSFFPLDSKSLKIKDFESFLWVYTPHAHHAQIPLLPHWINPVNLIHLVKIAVQDFLLEKSSAAFRAESPLLCDD